MFKKLIINTYQNIIIIRSSSRRSTSNMASIDFVENGKKILGAALNYMDIVRSKNVPIPQAPVVFLKPTSSYIKEGDNIIIPKSFSKVAYEVELGVIIGKKCKNVSKEDAMCYIAGYCLALDLTAQCELGNVRKNGMPWSISKGFDTSTPVSRLLTLNEIKDPNNLQLWLKINNEVKQNGNTKDLIYKIPELIEYCSKYMTLEVNDLILTGTPDGAAPMKSGDILECGLDNLICMKFNVLDE